MVEAILPLPEGHDLAVLDDAVTAMQTRLAEIDQQIGPLAVEADALRDALARLDANNAASAGRPRSPRRAKPSGATAKARTRKSNRARAPRGQIAR